MENLSVYKDTDKTFTVTLPSSLSGATDVRFFLNSKEDINYSGTTIFSGHTGTTVNGVTTFEITAIENNIPEGVYFYNVGVISGTKRYVIASGSYSVLPSLIQV